MTVNIKFELKEEFDSYVFIFNDGITPMRVMKSEYVLSDYKEFDDFEFTIQTEICRHIESQIRLTFKRIVK